MTRRLVAVTAILAAIGLAIATAPIAAQNRPSTPTQAPAGPVLVIQMEKGPIEIELFAADAPKSVAHIIELVRRSFYRSQRFHRVIPSLVQIGDPLSRDMSRQGYWGNGSSGNPIGVAEFSKKYKHVRGTVGLAHSGAPAYADSQIYIMKTASPSLDGKHVIIGRVTSGMAIVDRIAVADRAVNVYLKGEGPK
jgi:cyclophilin family peptidyl-prolyl cis-trans isomerase